MVRITYWSYSTIRLHPLFHVINLRSCPTVTLRPCVHVTTLEDDGEYEIDHTSIIMMARADGAAAAAPDGGALSGHSAFPHLPVMGVGDPVALSCLAR
jgi:hypothetical protein